MRGFAKRGFKADRSLIGMGSTINKRLVRGYLNQTDLFLEVEHGVRLQIHSQGIDAPQGFQHEVQTGCCVHEFKLEFRFILHVSPNSS